tara:strand:+ start:402 stop:548 length:147 start_codon:yes stop_codon:yes gene_type:complete
MDSTIEEKVTNALAALKDSGVSYLLMVEDDSGIAYFSNNKADRLYIVD